MVVEEREREGYIRQSRNNPRSRSLCGPVLRRSSKVSTDTVEVKLTCIEREKTEADLAKDGQKINSTGTGNGANQYIFLSMTADMFLLWTIFYWSSGRQVHMLVLQIV
jgi:hypothetical protein